jgi:hypothetical protein
VHLRSQPPILRSARLIDCLPPRCTYCEWGARWTHHPLEPELPFCSLAILILTAFPSLQATPNTTQLVALRPIPPNRLSRLARHPLGPLQRLPAPPRKILRPCLYGRTTSPQPQPLRRIAIRRPPPPRRHHLAHSNQTPHPDHPPLRNAHPKVRIQTSHHRGHLLRARNPHPNRDLQRLPQHPRNLHPHHNPQYQTLLGTNLPPPNRADTSS